MSNNHTPVDHSAADSAWETRFHPPMQAMSSVPDDEWPINRELSRQRSKKSGTGAGECKGRPREVALKPTCVIVTWCFYFFRSTTHSQCESPRTIFLVSVKVKFGFRLSVAPAPHA
jgi:hypothetical protein